MLRFSALASEPRSIELILREWLETGGNQEMPATLNTPQRCRELEDHLGLLMRWFYKKPRVGEIFFREATLRSTAAGSQDAASVKRNSEWPYRRILRACSRLLSPEEAFEN